jgi:hypothetical protein
MPSRVRRSRSGNASRRRRPALSFTQPIDHLSAREGDGADKKLAGCRRSVNFYAARPTNT